MDSPILKCTIEEIEREIGVLRLEGEIDLSNSDEVVAQFQVAADRGLTNLLVDATGITFVDSSGIHALIDGKRVIHESGSMIVLVPSPQLRRLLELTFPEAKFSSRVETVDEGLSILRGATESR